MRIDEVVVLGLAQIIDFDKGNQGIIIGCRAMIWFGIIFQYIDLVWIEVMQIGHIVFIEFFPKIVDAPIGPIEVDGHGFEGLIIQVQLVLLDNRHH